MATRFLRLPEVIQRTGLSRASIYARQADHTFPSAVPLGAHAVGWVESEVSDWCDAQVRAARGDSALEANSRRIEAP